MASLTDVAREAGVSVTTASMVLNPGKQENRVSDACAQRVRKIAKKLGYTPNYHARSMKLGRAEVIAVAIDYSAEPGESYGELGTSYFGQMLGAIEFYCRNIGYQMTIVGPSAAQRAPDRGYIGIRQRRFDGLIVPGTVVRPDRTSFMIDAPDAPIVVIEYAGATSLPVIDFDAASGIKLSIEHLAGLGHRRLLWIGADPNEPEAPSARQPIFRAFASELGIESEICTIAHTPAHGGGAITERVINDAQTTFLKYLDAHGRNFTAVVCENDRVGIGVCGGLVQAGLRVPTDVSVIGFDDIEAPLCIPRLTTVSHQLEQMGTRAAQMVMEMFADPAAKEKYRNAREVLPPKLVLRSSTAAPKK